MTVPAWDVLAGLPAWQVAELPRRAPRGGEQNGDAAELAAEELDDRMLSLAAACGEGSPVAFGWVREQAEGPVRVIAAGDGMRAEGAGARLDGEGLVKLGYPSSGARGVPLPPGGLAAAFDALSWWVPVAVTPDALLVDEKKNPGDDSRRKPYGHGVLRSWDGPFGWVVLAVPAGEDRHADLLAKASLEQLAAERHDAPRAQQAARRWKARHEEFRQAAVHGLWDIWLLAGAADKRDLMRVAGLVASSLHPQGMPFGLTRLKGRQGRLPEMLGALARPEGAPPAPEPGSLASEVLGMYGGQAPGPPRAAEPAARQPEPSRWTPGAQPPPEAPQQQYDSNGFPVWAPPRPGPGRSGGQQSSPLAGSVPLAPEFPDPEPQFPVAASSRLLAALAVPPSREVPGVRFTLEPDFDVTPETMTGGDGDGIMLGTILDAGRSRAGTVAVPRGSLNRHTFVCGATGAGKSQTVRHLLESAAHAGIPWLVIEPAKAEYRLMGARLPDAEVITIRPGDLDAVPAGINPLEPAAGPDGTRFPLQAHADLVRALFLAAFRADEPFPQVLAAALTRVYTEAGWDMLTGRAAEGAAYPGLGDLQAAALKVVEEIGYSQEITDNVRGFVSVRIGSLRSGTTGGFLDGGFPLDYSSVLSGNVVLEIEDCGDDSDKAFLTGAILVRLTEHLRMRARAEGPAAPGLRHLTVIEEAHRLLRQPADGEGGGPAAHAVEMFAGLLAEIRAYGEGLVIAEQIPSKLIPDVIKNTAIKIVHRLPAQDDRDSVGATMNLTDEQSRYLVTLRPGEAAVFTDGMDYPVLAKMPDGTGRESGTKIRSGKIGDLVSARSPACPPECRAAACTLRQVAAARRERGRQRDITLWAELTVAAHLAGWPSPEPPDTVRDRLAGLDSRLRDCTLGGAVDEAVAARVPAFAARIAAPALTAHVAGDLRGILDGSRGPCSGEDSRWQAPARAGAGRPGGLAVFPGTVLLRDAVLGTRSPSAIEEAAGTWAAAPDFAGQLARALAGFRDGGTYASGIADAMRGSSAWR